MKNICLLLRITLVLLLFGTTHALQAQTCDCKEYIYLNEPILGAVLKFEIGAGIPLTEVTGTNGPGHWYPGNGVSALPAPHGLGTDLNGNLYIGSSYDVNTPIRKFNCDGQIAPLDPTTINNQFILTNMFSIGNTIYTTRSGGPAAYNSCTGALIGTMCLNGSDGNPIPTPPTGYTNWGLSYNANTEKVYATQQFTGSNIWAFSRTQLEAGILGGACINPIITLGPNAVVNPGENFLPNTVGDIYGVTSDNSGNIYVVKGVANGSAILKYNAAGQFQIETPAIGSVGTIGIIWSETTNRIYVSNSSDDPNVDCISAFDANTLVYLGTAAPNPNLPTDNTAKAIAIIKECCPVNLSSTFQREVCGAIGTKFYLNEEAFDLCDGVVCGSSWTPTSLNGMTFDPCDNSVTITGAGGCSTFTLNIGAVSSTGCAAQSSTFTICNSTPPVVTASAGACNPSTNEYTLTGQVNISVPPATGTMTVSVSGGGSQVFTAPFAGTTSYTITGLNSGTATRTVTVTFSDAVSCVGTTTYVAPASCVPEGSCNCKEYIYLNEPDISAVLKFEVGTAIALTEVVGTNGGTPPAQHWYPGTGTSVLPSPHGIATDLNGQLYIGSNLDAGAPIRKLNCDGELDPAYSLITNGNTFNMFSIGNTLYKTGDGFGNGGPLVYDLCTQQQLGQVCLTGIAVGPFENWGLSYNEVTQTIYSSSVFGGPVHAYSLAQLEASIATGSCINPLIPAGTSTTINPGDNFMPSGNRYQGIVGDNMGNIYVAGFDLSTDAGFILKYDANGLFIARTPVNSRYIVSHGVVWSEESNRLYLANFAGSVNVDCISVFDADNMSYLGTGAPNPPVGGTVAKALGIIKECCPINLPSTFTKNTCGGVGEKFYLNQEAFDTCDGIVCGSSWTPTSLNGMTFDDCDNSVTITGAGGCSTFTLNIGAVSSTGCGAQNSTFTICNSTPPVVTASAGACNPSTNEYTLTGQVNISVPPATGTMTVSVSGGGSQIFIAPFAGTTPYTITGLNSGDATRTVTVTFSDAVSCVGTTTYAEPAACAPVGSCNCTEYIYLNEPTPGHVLKFEVGNTPTLTQIPATGGGPWYPGTGVSELGFPHGIATDLNGFLYVGARATGGEIRKLDCDGNIFPITGTTVVDPGTHTNMFSIGNTLYVTGQGGPKAFDLCSGALIGQMCLEDEDGNAIPGTPWGLSYNPVTETVYAAGLTRNRVWAFSRAELEAGIAGTGTCIAPLIVQGANATVNIGENFTPNAATGVHGIVGDNDGNIYIVESAVVGGTGTYLLKYDAAGFLLATSPVDNVLGGGGYYFGMGMVWSETSNRLYVSNRTGDPTEDCISAFDAATMAYVGTAAPNPLTGPGSNYGKAIGIIKECCPVNLPMAFTKEVCGGIGDKFYLNVEAFDGCNGTVCGSSWTPTSLNGMTFDPCDNSVLITSSTGCSTFTLDISAVSSTGCGVQFSTFTICNRPAPTVSTSITCNTATEYTLSGTVIIDNPPATGTLTIMDSQGGSQVINAPFVSPIAYSIAGLTKDGITHTVTVVFSEATTCSTAADYSVPQAEIVEAGDPATICRTRNLVLSSLGASVSPSGLAATWSTNGDGTFTGGTSYAGATEYVPGANDIATGQVTLTLTSNTIGSPCPVASDAVIIDILKVDCGTFPWPGGKP